MPRFAQAGIVIGVFGIVLAFMGLFPGVTGVTPTIGVGLIQVVMLMTGNTLLTVGALMYIKYTFYADSEPNLTQQIGTRLALTGLLFATISGLADILGFGSHLRTDTGDIFFGQWQAFGLLASLAFSSIGVMLYAVAGDPDIKDVEDNAPSNETTEEIKRVEIPEEETIEISKIPLIDPDETVDIIRK